MANDGHVRIGTELDESGLKKGLSGLGNFAQKGLSAVTTGVKAATAAVGVAAAGMTALTTQAIQEYANYEQLVGGVETLFKTSSDTVIKYADDAYKTAGMSANEYMDTVTSFSASLLQSLDQDTAAAAEKANQAITDMSDNANKMGSDMQMIQNAYQGFAKQNYTMLDKLKLGYGGTKEEMQRLLDDATALSGVEYDLSSFADVVDAIHVVQTEMGITGTTAKEASSTISGSIDSMKSAWKNFLTGMADEDADFGKLTDNLIDSALTVLDNLAPRIAETIPRLAAGMGELIGQAGTYLPDILSQTLSDLTESVATNMPQLMASGAKIAQGIGSGILSAAGSLASMGSTILSNLASGLSENMPSIAERGIEIIDSITKGITSNLPGIVSSGVEIITSLVNGIAQMLPSLLNMAVEAIISFAMSLTDPATLTQIISAGVNLIVQFISGISQALPLLFEAAPTIIANIVTALIQSIPLLASAALQIMTDLGTMLIKYVGYLLSVIPDVITKVKDKFAGTDWAEVGKNIIEGIKNGIVSAAGRLVDAAVQAAKDAVEAVKGWLGIASPSKLMRDLIGKNMIAGITVGIQSGTPEMIAASQKSVKKLVEGMQTASMMAYPEYRLPRNPGGDADGGAEGSGGVVNNYIFNQPVETPDETARAIRKVNEFGLAGER